MLKKYSISALSLCTIFLAISANSEPMEQCRQDVGELRDRLDGHINYPTDGYFAYESRVEIDIQQKSFDYIYCISNYRSDHVIEIVWKNHSSDDSYFHGFVTPQNRRWSHYQSYSPPKVGNRHIFFRFGGDSKVRPTLHRSHENGSYFDQNIGGSLFMQVQFDANENLDYDDIYSSQSRFLDHVSRVGSLNITSEATLDVPLSAVVANSVAGTDYEYNKDDWMTLTIGFSSVVSAASAGEYTLHGSMFYRSAELDGDDNILEDEQIFVQMTGGDFLQEYDSRSNSTFRIPYDPARRSMIVGSFAPIVGAVSERMTNIQIIDKDGEILGSTPVVYFSTLRK